MAFYQPRLGSKVAFDWGNGAADVSAALRQSVVGGLVKREETDIQVDVVSFPSDDLTLKGLLSRPDGAGPFPAVLFNHGAGRAYERVITTLGPVFIEQGYTFFMPYRRGHGLSSDQAPYFNDILKAASDRGGSEERDREMVRLLEGPYLTDQLAALKWYRQQPFVDAERIFVIGSSLGGIQSLLIAAETSQIKASVSFAAAALSWSDSAALRESMLSAASAAKVPIMFIQAENDADTTPSRALAATMAAAGKPHRLKIFPKFGETTQDGHNFGYFGSQVWEQDLFDFFNEQINYTSIKRSIRHQFEGSERVGERQSK